MKNQGKNSISQLRKISKARLLVDKILLTIRTDVKVTEIPIIRKTNVPVTLCSLNSKTKKQDAINESS